MDELGDKLNAVLNDPEQMKRIADMAKSLMGGGMGGPAQEEPKEVKREQPAEEASAPLFDPGMLGKLSSFMKKGESRSETHALLEAMKPYLSEKRRNKMDKALKLAKFASIAELLTAQFKESDDGLL